MDIPSIVGVIGEMVCSRSDGKQWWGYWRRRTHTLVAIVVCAKQQQRSWVCGVAIVVGHRRSFSHGRWAMAKDSEGGVDSGGVMSIARQRRKEIGERPRRTRTMGQLWWLWTMLDFGGGGGWPQTGVTQARRVGKRWRWAQRGG